MAENPWVEIGRVEIPRQSELTSVLEILGVGCMVRFQQGVAGNACTWTHQVALEFVKGVKLNDDKTGLIPIKEAGGG